MPADGDTRRSRRVLSKGRMESFSDGVFALAVYLVVPFREVARLLFRRS